MNPNGGDIIQLTNSTNQTGSIWSDGDNYFNVYRKQTMSMWLYFGRSIDVDNMAGMAFVIQNGGLDAISSFNGHSNSGETLGVWGSEGKVGTQYVSDTRTYTDGEYPTVQAQAIQKSWALEFDSKTNSNATSLKDAGNKYAAWKANKYDATNLPEEENGFDWGPYVLPDSSSDNNFIFHPHIAWNYPAEASSYTQLSSSRPSATKIPFTNKVIYGGHSLIALNHRMGSLSTGMNGPNANFSASGSTAVPADAWRHLTIDYTPPSSGDTMGQIRYRFGDRNVDGTPAKMSSDNGDVDGTAALDLSKLYLEPGQTNVRYGFTAATGTAAVSNTVLFETMPSLVNATNEAKVYNDSKDGDEVKSGGSVNGDDELRLQYDLNYEDGDKDLSNITLTAPKLNDVTYYQKDGHFGEVNYYDDDGNLKSTEYLDTLAVDNNNYSIKLNQSLNDKLDDAPYRKVKVTLYAKADSAEQDVAVTQTTAKYEGDLYRSDFETPNFTIKKTTYIPKITPDEGTQDQTVPIDGQIAIGGTVTRGKQGKEDELSEFKDTDMDIYVNLDNSGYQAIGTLQDDDVSTSGHFTIANDQMGLDVGKHTIAVRAVYGSEESEEVVYNVDVVKLALMASATKEQRNLTVKDLSIVKLNGTIAYSNNQEITSVPIDDDNAWKVNMTITNQDDGFTMKSAQPFEPNISEDGKSATYQGKLYPGYGPSVEQAYIHKGINKIDLTISDPNGMKSGVVTYYVNVPDQSPILSPENTDIKVVNGDANIELPAKVTYNVDKDDGYTLSTGRLQWVMDVDGTYSGIVKPFVANVDEANIVQSYSRTELGITDDTEDGYTVHAHLIDGYGRTSNKINYNFSFIRSSATLQCDDNYAFQTINQSPEERLVGRKGDWNIAVNTVDSDYILSAKAGNMVSTDLAQNINLAGQMVYVDPNSGNMKTMDKLVLLDSNDEVTTKEHPINWDDNNGILLQVDANARAGTYKGDISWNLTDSVQE
ncbi:hypothetical protein [Companilactobacillus hulinensis]|uniref:hypothetical protein n=1 Tax=Companilactobacillus hulinensis TaxID=2486007 RepID=UPI000F76ABF4|nr:hypothetical protein [Companilactobacillus hulinensis]